MTYRMRGRAGCRRSVSRTATVVRRIASIVLGTALLAMMTAGCAARWSIALQVDQRPTGAITAQAWRAALREFPDEALDGKLVLLDRLLWETGVSAVESVAIGNRSLDWAKWAEDTWVTGDGRLIVGDEPAETAAVLAVSSPPEADMVTSTHLDLAPTIAGALGVPSPRRTSGRALDALRAERVVLVILDGLGYRQFEEYRGPEATPFLDGLAGTRLARGVYPSTTRVSMAAMLSGAAPADNGVRDRNTRDITAETILQVLAAAGRRAVVVEGDALPINMAAAEARLSGDRDGDGHTDDNTLANALAVVAEGMPEFLLVHWHGIDDAGHTYGPGSAEYRERLSAVDGYLQQLVSALPENTLLLITADHGMRPVVDEERLGNHGTLSGEDMLVPLWVVAM